MSKLTDWSEYKTTLGLSQEEWDEIDAKVKKAGEVIALRERIPNLEVS